MSWDIYMIDEYWSVHVHAEAHCTTAVHVFASAHGESQRMSALLWRNAVFPVDIIVVTCCFKELGWLKMGGGGLTRTGLLFWTAWHHYQKIVKFHSIKLGKLKLRDRLLVYMVTICLCWLLLFHHPYIYRGIT